MLLGALFVAGLYSFLASASLWLIVYSFLDNSLGSRLLRLFLVSPSNHSSLYSFIDWQRLATISSAALDCCATHGMFRSPVAADIARQSVLSDDSAQSVFQNLED